MYRCTSVMVVTNGLFTLAAQKLAKAHRVGLVDRMRLERLAISGRRTQDAAGTTSTRTVADTNRTHMMTERLGPWRRPKNAHPNRFRQNGVKHPLSDSARRPLPGHGG